MKKHFIDLFTYRWRYVLGYGALILMLIVAILIAGLYAPGGLSLAEIKSIAPIYNWSAEALAIPNLPLKILQTGIFSLFGVSILTIKLPSIILAIVTSLAIFFLLRRWFKPNVAIPAMLIMVTTGQYLFTAQSATANILYVLYSALILLFASLILQKAKHALLWKIGLALSLALSLYTPYLVYINLGLLIVACIHPHTRYHILRRSARLHWLIAASIFALFIIPLVYLCSVSPDLLGDLLGLNNLAHIDIISGVKTLLFTYFWITPIVANSQIIPILDFAALAIAILGLIVLFQQRHSARTYMIVAWTILTLPLLIIDPKLTAIITVPLIIILSVGFEALLREWYKLFPKNPYARGVGLIFTSALIGIMVLSGIDQFMNGYRFMPAAAREFQADVTLVNAQVKERPVRTLLLVSDDELPLYTAIAHYNYPGIELVVATDTMNDAIGNVIVTRAAREQVPLQGWELQGIITNDRYEDGDRLYLYKAPTHKVQ